MKLIEKIKSFIKPKRKTKSKKEIFLEGIQAFDELLSKNDAVIHDAYNKLFQMFLVLGRIRAKNGYRTHFEIDLRDGYRIPERIEKGLVEYIQRLHIGCDVTIFRDLDDMSVETSDKSGKDGEDK